MGAIPDQLYSQLSLDFSNNSVPFISSGVSTFQFNYTLMLTPPQEPTQISVEVLAFMLPESAAYDFATTTTFGELGYYAHLALRKANVMS
jgi:hypothetical protein